MTQKIPLKAWGLLLTLSLIWGSSFILIKKGLIGLAPMELGAVRILSASLFMLPFAIRSVKKVRKEHVKYLISVGFVGSFTPAFLFAIAQTKLESSITGVLLHNLQAAPFDCQGACPLAMPADPFCGRHLSQPI